MICLSDGWLGVLVMSDASPRSWSKKFLSKHSDQFYGGLSGYTDSSLGQLMMLAIVKPWKYRLIVETCFDFTDLSKSKWSIRGRVGWELKWLSFRWGSLEKYLLWVYSVLIFHLHKETTVGGFLSRSSQWKENMLLSLFWWNLHGYHLVCTNCFSGSVTASCVRVEG